MSLTKSQQNSALEKGISKAFLKWFDFTFQDKDKIDLISFYDSSLNEEEVKEIFMVEFEAFLSEEYKDKQARETAKATKRSIY